MITHSFDLPILQWIRQNMQCSLLDKLMPAITHLGDAGAVWILLALVLICRPKWRKTGLTIALALGIGMIVCNLTLKPLVARIRPYAYMLQHYAIQIPLLIPAPADFSFPSGHTIASFEAATVLLLHHRKWGICAMILAALIAFSRLYLYVHYPTDVLTSVGLGIGIGFFAVYLCQKGNCFQKQKKNTI